MKIMKEGQKKEVDRWLVLLKQPALNPVNFFVHGCLMYHDGKPEGTVQLLEAVGEAAGVISNE